MFGCAYRNVCMYTCVPRCHSWCTNDAVSPSTTYKVEEGEVDEPLGKQKDRQACKAPAQECWLVVCLFKLRVGVHRQDGGGCVVVLYVQPYTLPTFSAIVARAASKSKSVDLLACTRTRPPG